jgi:hypothetical protein
VEGRPAVARTAAPTIPAGAAVVEVHVPELRQLFNAIDPSPFRERDLDPRAEAFIVEWSREVPQHVPLALLVHVDRASDRGDEAALLREAVQAYFGAEAQSARRRLRRLFLSDGSASSSGSRSSPPASAPPSSSRPASTISAPS